MCGSCWMERGAPRSWNPAMQETIDLIAELYQMPEGITGALLHCELDDWNLDGDFVIDSNRNEYYSQDVVDLCHKIADRMRPLSLDERYTVLAHHEGILSSGREVEKWVGVAKEWMEERKRLEAEEAEEAARAVNPPKACTLIPYGPYKGYPREGVEDGSTNQEYLDRL